MTALSHAASYHEDGRTIVSFTKVAERDAYLARNADARPVSEVILSDAELVAAYGLQFEVCASGDLGMTAVCAVCVSPFYAGTRALLAYRSRTAEDKDAMHPACSAEWVATFEVSK